VPRHSKFDADRILDAALAAIAVHGKGTTIAQVGEQIDVSMGSIYHRFDSRDELFGALWLRQIHHIHQYLFAVMDAQPEPRAALCECAVAVVRYVREQPASSLAMTLFSQARLIAEGPPSLRPQAAVINDAIFARLTELAVQAFPAAPSSPVLTAPGAPGLTEYVFTVVCQLPLGLIRSRVGGPVPLWFDSLTAVCADAALSAICPPGADATRPEADSPPPS
jgi:AcrR family transcriptional regulator